MSCNLSRRTCHGSTEGCGLRVLLSLPRLTVGSGSFHLPFTYRSPLLARMNLGSFVVILALFPSCPFPTPFVSLTITSVVSVRRGP